MRHTHALLFALIATVTAAGCTAGTTRREDFCAQTACEQSRLACERDHAENCRRCQDALFDAYRSGITPIGGCSSSCGPSHCAPCRDGANDHCAEPGVRFVLPEPDTGVQAACERAAARDRRCNELTVNPACAASASLERPEHAAVYECIAGVACGAPVDACASALRPGSLGDELCARMSAVCGGRACEAGFRAAYAAMQPWLRDDALAAIRGCVSESSCEGFARCVNAFSDAVNGMQARAGAQR